MAHRGISAAVVGRVMALGAEWERHLVPDVSGCGLSKAPSEEANISSSRAPSQSVTCWRRILGFSAGKEGKGPYFLCHNH